jgi:carboxylesterase type B
LMLGDPAVLKHYNEHPEFLVPLSFKLQPNTADFNEAKSVLQNQYFNGQATGNLDQWLKFYSDALFRFPSDRAFRFYADNPKVPIYYYDFTFDGTLNYFKKFFNLPFPSASHADELFYLFETELEGFIPDANSTLVRNRMIRMWTNFAKFG